LHLVNLTNPMAMKGPYRDFFPVGPLTVKLTAPEGVRAKEAKLLVSEKVVGVERSGATLTLTVPPILDHEVVAVEI
jgi:hypothetical protein